MAKTAPLKRRVPGGLSLRPLILMAGLALPLVAQDSEVITRIEVVGNLKLSAETVIFKAGLKPGTDLRNLDLTAVMQRLWATGSFDDIKFEVVDEKDGKKLLIRVAERPVVKEVDYRGGTEVGLTNLKDKLKEKKLTINPDTVYDPDAARKVKALIVEQCAEKGFRNALVDISLEPLGPGVSRLVFDIKEGAKVHIYKVTFRGNKAIGTPQLRRIMQKTRQHWSFSWLTSHDLLVDKSMEEDLLNLKKAYWRLGYKDVFVGQPVIQVEDRTTPRQKKRNERRAKEAKSPKYDLRATLEIPILEGDRYFEGHTRIEGNDKLFRGEKGTEYLLAKLAEARRDNRSVLAKFFNIKPSTKDLPANANRPFDLDALNQGVDKIRELYSNQAYIQFRAEKKMEVREEGGVKKVDTILRLDEGEPYTIRRINFEGNTLTKDKVLRRALFVREGDPFRVESFKDSLTGLGQLGFFDVKGREPGIVPVPDKPQVDVTIYGEEAGVNELLFQGGYGTVFGLSLGVSFSTKNLGGGGETLGFSYNGGKYSKSASISFTEPYVFDLPYFFSASISDGSTDYDASRVGEAYAYREKSRTLGLATGAKLGTWFPNQQWAFFTSYSVGYSLRMMRIEGGRSYYFRDTNTQLTSSVNQSLSYTTVDHPYKPTTGTKLAFTLEYGGWQFGTDRPYMRASWDFTKYANISDRHIFGLNVTYGYLRNLSSEQMLPWELFRPGGENSIRGYRYGQVGSLMEDNLGNPIIVGGNKQFIANAEYQFKIADQFRVVAFYDAGNAWGPGRKVFSESLRRSAGLEFRFFLPISPAPMRLIWSRKLNPYPFDTDGKTDFQFSIGTTF